MFQLELEQCRLWRVIRSEDTPSTGHPSSRLPVPLRSYFLPGTRSSIRPAGLAKSL